MEMNFKKLTSLLTSLIIFSLNAAETDQFYAKDAIIKDSTKAFNDYFNEKIEIALHKSNQKEKVLSCREVAREVLTQVLGEFSLIDFIKDREFSKVSFFTQNSPLVDRFPEDSIKTSVYRKDSIYKHRPFPINVAGISRTININGIYIGTDKIGHISIIGKRYYSNFLKELASGKNESEAEEIAITKGIKQEIAILGYTVGGVMSYADLEANYQGFLFARDMCEGPEPLLEFFESEWRKNPRKSFEIRDYVNPKMDEAYNVSFWSPRMWKRMKTEIVQSYCNNNENPSYLKRKERYDSLVEETINDKIISSYIKTKPKFDRAKQLLSPDIICH